MSTYLYTQKYFPKLHVVSSRLQFLLGCFKHQGITMPFFHYLRYRDFIDAWGHIPLESTFETRTPFSCSPNLHKIFHICSVCDSIHGHCEIQNMQGSHILNNWKVLAVAHILLNIPNMWVQKWFPAYPYLTKWAI